MRDYDVMHNVIKVMATPTRRIAYIDFSNVKPNNLVVPEMQRLIADGLVEGNVREDLSGVLMTFDIAGLTDEGREFWKLIENEDVWAIIRDTLRKADIDVSYPLLKEVCEEIVKRYVTSFIPNIRR